MIAWWVRCIVVFDWSAVLKAVLVRILNLGAGLSVSRGITICDELEASSAIGSICGEHRVFFMFDLYFHFHWREQTRHRIRPSSSAPTIILSSCSTQEYALMFGCIFPLILDIGNQFD